MTRFVLVGLNSLGEIQRLDLRADTRTDAHREATQIAKRAGLQLVEIAVAGSRRIAPSRHRVFASFFRRERFDVALFVYELLALLRAGLALTEALETLDERRRRKQSDMSDEGSSHYVLAELVKQMHEGKSFSAALAAHPACFPSLLAAMTAASEQTSGITQALERFLQYQAQVNLVRQKLVSASLYPALLLVTGTVVAFFLVWFLAPRFAHVYEGMSHVQLPVLSQWLIQFGLFVSQHTAQSLTCLGVLLVTVVVVTTRPLTQQRLLAALGQVTWIGDTLKLMQLARFYRSLAMLLHGGVALLPSLRMTRELLPPGQQDCLLRSMADIGQGRSLSDSLHEEGLMTSVALRLLRAGERNGQIATMLEQSALFHEHEISQWVERFARLIEPVLMLVMGASIGLIVVLLYLPIFDLAGSIQ